MKKIFFVLVLFIIAALASPVNATDYYVRPHDSTTGCQYGSCNGTSYANAWEGFSGGNGTPVNWTTLDRGPDNIDGNSDDGRLFICGTHREELNIDADGEDGTPVYVSSCTIAKGATVDDPGVILGSHDLGSTGDWTYDGGNVWYASISEQVGNMIFDNEASLGLKESTLGAVDDQGDFYWDDPTDRVYLYSISNPGSYYSAIEAAVRATGLNAIINTDNDWITIDGLEIKYGGYHGIKLDGYATSVDNIVIQNCKAKYIGGAYQVGTTRAGDGISIYGSATEITVRYNWFDQVWDVGIANDGAEPNQTKMNHYIYYNLVTNSDFGGQTLAHSATATTTGIKWYNNTFYNCGGGWASEQDPNEFSRGGFFNWLVGGIVSGCEFKNNIIHTAEQGGGATYFCNIFVDNHAVAAGGWTYDYNLYYPDGAAKFYWYPTNSNFTGWETVSSQDLNSISSDPLFVNAGKDFHLLPKSPCINAGIDVGLTQDFDGNPIVGVPNIGAFESTLYSLSPPRNLRVIEVIQ